MASTDTGGSSAPEQLQAAEFEASARQLLEKIEAAHLHATILSSKHGRHGRVLSLVNTKLDEARLWLQDAIGYGDQP